MKNNEEKTKKIMEILEEFLEEKDIFIPCEKMSEEKDRVLTGNHSRLYPYSSEYKELKEKIQKVLGTGEKRDFLYEPYGDGNAVIVYFHQRPTHPGYFDDCWDITGVDVPTKGCMEWSFWRMISTTKNGIYDGKLDLTDEEKEEIKKYILEHQELVPNIFK